MYLHLPSPFLPLPPTLPLLQIEENTSLSQHLISAQSLFSLPVLEAGETALKSPN